jgi:hypothetical protein
MACSDAGSGATSPLSIAESDDKDTGLKFDRIMPRRIRNYDRSAIALNKKTAKDVIWQGKHTGFLRQQQRFWQPTPAGKSSNIDMDGVFFHAVAACDESHDAADIPADVIHIRRREPIFQISSDHLVLAEGDHMEIVCILGFKIMRRSRSGTVQIVLQLRRYFYTGKQPAMGFKHCSFSFAQQRIMVLQE